MDYWDIEYKEGKWWLVWNDFLWHGGFDNSDQMAEMVAGNKWFGKVRTKEVIADVKK